ncbi:MAG: hypothetical protein JSU07_02215 [Bacteroidetes bacterium]|nr:hypothetical protein [Bacteroidota bacterium]
MCINLYFGNIDGTAYISMNAFNFWHLIFSGELWNKSDQLSIGFLNYKQTGLLLFFTSSFMALYPLIKIVYQKFILKTIPALLSANAILIMASLIYFLFFFFNTQMHERYSHAGVFFLVVYALLNSKWVLLILGGGAYFLNLEAVLRFFNLNYLAFCFTPKFIASLFLLIIMTLFVKLYTEVSVKKSCNSF